MDSILANALGRNATHLAAAEKRELLARLFARLAHEIRNPLSSLQIHVQLLEEELAQTTSPKNWQKTAGRWELIHGELKRLENIVTRFLQLAGPSSLDLEPVEIDRVIDYVRKLVEPEALSRRIQLEVKVASGLPVFMGDGDKLKQALLNLLVNALQAVDRDGRVRLVARLTGPSGALLIEVADSGPGVPPEKSAIIFDPFFTTKSEGSGLGLWIVQQIVAAHGGTIRVSDGADRGAVFTILLPVEPRALSHG